MEKLIVGIVCFLSFTGLAHAEIIYLKDGSIVKGSIVSSNEEVTTIKTSLGEITIEKVDIKKVEYEKLKEPEAKKSEEKPAPILAEKQIFELNAKTGFGLKVSSTQIPKATLKIFVTSKDFIDIEGGASSLGWVIGGQYVNHFMKIDKLWPFFCIGMGISGNVGIFVTGGAGVEYFATKQFSFFAEDRLFLGSVAFTAEFDSGLRYYF